MAVQFRALYVASVVGQITEHKPAVYKDLDTGGVVRGHLVRLRGDDGETVDAFYGVGAEFVNEMIAKYKDPRNRIEVSGFVREDTEKGVLRLDMPLFREPGRTVALEKAAAERLGVSHADFVSGRTRDLPEVFAG